MKKIIKEIFNLDTLEATQKLDVPTTFIKENYDMLSEFVTENFDKTLETGQHTSPLEYTMLNKLKLVKNRSYKNFTNDKFRGDMLKELYLNNLQKDDFDSFK